MIEELVFHLGDCKTGTTSLQLTLAENGWEAPGRSIAYTAKVNHIPLAKTLTVEREKRFAKPRWTGVRRAFHASEAQQGVISAEHFEFVAPEALDAALKQYMPRLAKTARLIAYVRPHADRLVSTFSERVKKGNFSGQMEDMHRRLKAQGMLYYTPRFEKWRQVFGDRFTLHPMVRDQLYKGDVVEDFFHYLFRSEDFRITRSDATNSSLSLEDLAMMREIQERIASNNPGINPAQQALGWNIAPMLAGLEATTRTKLALHRHLAERVAETYADDAAALDAAFFEGTPMSDALAAAAGKAIAEPQSVLASDHFSADEVRRLHAIADFLTRIMEADPRYFTRAARPPEHRNKPIVPTGGPDEENNEDNAV
ncbi:hypothetical protein [Chachezhania sediminis]|uniref:hypothetical protein n=1 Tax=Chachezhania sediminis TaxID=2599291 RepID=UPI00131C446C|nr:hypothetical protein [Chachezhania sediminis]